MKPSLYKVADIGKGTLFVMPKPSSDYLDDDLRFYKNTGVDVLISFLEAVEAWELGLEQESLRASAIGLDFFHFPVQDRSVPTIRVVEKMLSVAVPLLDAGKGVSLHCRAGIGRSGLAACCILMKYGYQSDEAISMVSSARGVTVPDTSAQIDFIHNFASAVRP